MNGGNGREHADREALRERLSAFLDGELAPADAATLERHLAACAACRDELAALREVRSLLRALPPPALPRSFTLPQSAALQAAHAPVAGRSPPDRPQGAAARSRHTPARVPALARAAQWVGGLAAAIGLLLLVTTALLGGNVGLTSSAATSAGETAHAPLHGSATNPQQTASAPSRQTPTRSSVAPGTGTATPTEIFGPGTTASPAAPTATNGPATSSASPAAEPLPPLPVAGAGLLAGGLVVFGAGSVAARRRQRPPGRPR